MSDDQTARFGLPLLRAGQAQKEMFHNEALTLADLLVQPVAAGVGIEAPPDTPTPGTCWIVGASPSGAWAGQAHAVAGWTDGGWRFIAPREGMMLWSAADYAFASYVDGAWQVGVLRGASVVLAGQQVVGARGVAVPDPAGGATVDVEARAAIAALLARVRAHGLIDS